MKTKLLSKIFNLKKAYLFTALFFVSLIAFAQEPVTSNNTEITGATVEFAFDEEVTDTKNNVKERIVDNDPDTDWAGNLGNATGEASIIINLGAAYDLAEIQYLTVAKSDPYGFKLLVSTNGTDYTDVYGGALQQSNLDATYKQFVLPSVQTAVTHVKLICFGRVNASTEANTSAWNTISELKFYLEGSTASLKDNELSGASFYPNPANNSLILSNFSDKANKVQVVSLEGKVILSRNINSLEKDITIDTSLLANGIYLVKLSDTTRNLNASKMIVIQH